MSGLNARWGFAAAVAVLAGFTAPNAMAGGGPVAADTIYRHAVVLTVDEAHPRAQAVAVRAGRIVGVGGDREIMRRWGRGAHSPAVSDFKTLAVRTALIDLAAAYALALDA